MNTLQSLDDEIAFANQWISQLHIQLTFLGRRRDDLVQKKLSRQTGLQVGDRVGKGKHTGTVTGFQLCDQSNKVMVWIDRTPPEFDRFWLYSDELEKLN